MPSIDISRSRTEKETWLAPPISIPNHATTRGPKRSPPVEVVHNELEERLEQRVGPALGHGPEGGLRKTTRLLS